MRADRFLGGIKIQFLRSSLSGVIGVTLKTLIMVEKAVKMLTFLSPLALERCELIEAAISAADIWFGELRLERPAWAESLWLL